MYYGDWEWFCNTGVVRWTDLVYNFLYTRDYSVHFCCSEVLEHGEEFLSLTKEQLISLISNDHIRVSEEQVFEAALRWMRHDVATRGTPEVAAEVCGHVRFGLLPRDYLVRLSQSEDFLRSNPWCKDFLLEAMGFLLLPWEQRRRNITSERTRPRSIGVPKVCSGSVTFLW